MTVYLDFATWRQFRIACLQHGTSASKEISRFIREQLAAWERTAASAVPAIREE